MYSTACRAQSGVIYMLAIQPAVHRSQWPLHKVEKECALDIPATCSTSSYKTVRCNRVALSEELSSRLHTRQNLHIR